MTRIVVGLSAFSAFSLKFLTATACFLFVPRDEGRPIRRGVHDVFHVRTCHRLSEKVARFNGCFDHIALKHPLFQGSHGHLVFRLFVLLHMKSACGRVLLAARSAHADAVIAERSIRWKIKLPVNRPKIRKREVLLQHRFAVGILDKDLRLLSGGNPIVLSASCSQNHLEMYGVSGTINGAVGIDVTCAIRLRIAAQVIGVWRENGDVIVLHC